MSRGAGLQTHPAKGMALILASTLFFSLMSLGVREAKGLFHADSLVFYRSVIQMILLVPWWSRYFDGRSARRHFAEKLRVHLPRGIFGILAMGSVYLALQWLPMALSSLLGLTSVIWATLFGHWWLGERLSRRQLVLALVTLCGLGLSVLRQGQGGWVLHPIGVAAGLASGLFMGLAQTQLRKMRGGLGSREIVFFFGLCGVVLSAPLVLWRGEFPSGAREVAHLIAIGGLATAGQLFMTAGFRYAPTTLGSLCLFLGTFWNLLAGFVFLHEVPPPTFWVGGTLALAGLVALFFERAAPSRAEVGSKIPPG